MGDDDAKRSPWDSFAFSFGGKCLLANFLPPVAVDAFEFRSSSELELCTELVADDEFERVVVDAVVL